MNIVNTNGSNKDFYSLCEKLDKSLNENVPGRTASGMNSLYNVDKISDVFLLYDDNKAIASAGLWYHDSDTCEIMRVFVDEAYRGQGLVAKVVAEVERLAKKQGYNKIFLRTWASTPFSVRAYEKLGYKQVLADDFEYKDKFPNAFALAYLRYYMKKELV
jgi:RimJ/RimL family protein N-acetyltransferase